MATEDCSPYFVGAIARMFGASHYDRVVELELYGAAIDDSTADPVLQFRHLRKLVLRQTSISQPWLNGLRETLPQCVVSIE